MSPTKKAVAKSATKRSPAKKRTSTTKPAPARDTECQEFFVKVKITTQDQKIEITFGIRKTCKEDGTASWLIDFLFKEKDGITIEVQVGIGKQEDKEKAERLAARMEQTQSLSRRRVELLQGEVTTRALELTPEEAQDDPEIRGLLRDVL
jgi:hypothetical protein